MNTVIPSNLPNLFDSKSLQWWTRRSELWAVREVLDVMALRLHGQL